MGFCDINEHVQASVFTQLYKLYDSFLNYCSEKCGNNDTQTNIYCKSALKK